MSVEGHGEVQQQLPLLHTLDEGLQSTALMSETSIKNNPVFRPIPTFRYPLLPPGHRHHRLHPGYRHPRLPAFAAPGLWPPGRSPPPHTLQPGPAGQPPPEASLRWCRCSERQPEVGQRSVRGWSEVSQRSVQHDGGSGNVWVT